MRGSWGHRVIALAASGLSALSSLTLADAREPPLGDAERETTFVALPLAQDPPALETGLTAGAWPGALRLSAFFEISVANNGPPPVSTDAFLLRTESDLFVAFQLRDPRPGEIRAYAVPRDQVYSNQDFVQVEIDPTGDAQASQIFRVNPLGVQADGIFTESTGTDDFGPDFPFFAVTRTGPSGWSASLRIPLRVIASSRGALRWRILLLRNYPRADGYQMVSAKVPRQSTCWLCHATGVDAGATTAQGSVIGVLPYLSIRGAQPRAVDDGFDWGLDAQWQARPATRLQLTVNPDFSHVETDIPQLEANRRFTLEYPEKRPFFLEAADLLATPVAVMRTRSIVDPRWGARLTDRGRGADVTLLVAADGGGGSRIIPGAEASETVPSDEGAFVLLSRTRLKGMRTVVPGFGLSLREERFTGAYNRLATPDLRWQPRASDLVQAQLVLTDSREPNSPGLASVLDGERLRGTAWLATWRHASPRIAWTLEHGSFEDGVRAENGYLPQVGIRHWQGSGNVVLQPGAVLHRIEPGVSFREVLDQDGRLLERAPVAAVTLQGARSLVASLRYHPRDELRFAGELFATRYVEMDVSVQPGRWLSRLTAYARAGEEVDLDDVRLGTGRQLTLQARVHPTTTAELLIEGGIQALDVTADADGRGTLLRAEAVTAQVTQALTPGTHLRLRWTHEASKRDSLLDHEGHGLSETSWLASALVSVRLSTFTALFAGGEVAGGHDHVAHVRTRTERLFTKFSYQWGL